MFLALICANKIGSLVNNLFRVKIFNPVPVVFLFQELNLILLAIVSCKRNRIDNGDDDYPGFDICFVGVLCLCWSI